MRDDFGMPVKRALAGRVGNICSRPECGAQTSGPTIDPAKMLNIGTAAHITAASPDGPRYDATLTQQQRSSAENGIWLCQNCGKLVDNDAIQFPVELLRRWKHAAEDAAGKAIGQTGSSKRGVVVPPLSPKLQAPRTASDPETIALNLLWTRCQFYMRVVRLIDDIGHLPGNDVVNIPRPESYFDAKRALLLKFNDEYLAFQSDFEKGIDLLDAIVTSTDDTTLKKKIAAIIAAVREVATTVADLVAWSQNRGNEPINLGSLYRARQISDNAREASKHMADLVAARMIDRKES